MSMHSRIRRAVRQLLGGVVREELRTGKGSGAPAADSSRPEKRLSGGARRMIAVSGGVVLALVLTAMPASAAVVHNFEFSFNGSDAPAPFSYGGLSANGLDQSSPAFWVADGGQNILEKFDPSGAYAGVEVTGSTTPEGFAFSPSLEGVAVDDSGGTTTGDVYLSNHYGGVVDRFSSNGQYQCQITGAGSASSSASECDTVNGVSGDPGVGAIAPSGVAVDGAGNVWVANDAQDTVDEFGSDGHFVKQISDPNLTRPGAIALDQSGNIYVANAGTNVVEYDSTGTFVRTLDSNSSYGVAVDPVAGHVYVAETGDVAEYDSSGNLVSTFGSGTLGGSLFGISVRGSTGEVYVSDSSGPKVDVFGPDLVLPDAATSAASNLQPSSAGQGGSATLNGTVNPDGVQLSSCNFDYGTTTAYGQTAQCVPDAASIAADSNSHAVTADLAGLTPGTYHVRLVAGNANGSSQGQDQSFFLTGQPAIDDVAAVELTSSSTTLETRVNPDGFDTQAHFEYGTTTGYGSSTPSSDLGSTTSDQPLGNGITGLSPDTTYHYRVVATNSQGTVDGPDHTFTTASGAACPNAQFRTGPSADLPDCRTYEQVTPTTKDSFQPTLSTTEDNEVGLRASADGNRMAWTSFANPPGATSTGHQFLSSRGADGWAWAGLIPPQSTSADTLCAFAPNISAFSSDLSRWVLGDGAGQDNPPSAGDCGHDSPELVSGEPQGVQNLFANGLGASYQLITPNPVTGSPGDAQLCWASSDLSHVVFMSYAQLTADAPPTNRVAASTDLYDWSAAGGVHLLAVLPDGTAAPPVESYGDCGVSGSSATLTGLGGRTLAIPLHAGSTDGSRIFFQAGGNLYVRVNGDKPQSTLQGSECLQQTTSACTVQVDAAQGGAGSGGGEFQIASADGSQVFFTDSQQLTGDSTAGRNGASDLYRFDTMTGQLADLTVDPSDPNGAQVDGVTGTSDDGSYVYFVADGTLAADATTGQPNLYVWHGGTTKFIATLDPTAPGGGTAAVADRCNWSMATVLVDCARVSPSGRYLAFTSDKSLTGYDNVDPNGSCGANPQDQESYGDNCPEVFLYDAQSAQLQCASCSAVGAPATAPATIDDVPMETAGANLTLHELVGGVTFQRNLTVAADGTARVFFETAEPLLPQASNGNVNVYEYEAGQLHLISSGTGGQNDAFLDASATGDDVFFWSYQQLAPTDTDGSLDIYDARVGGGFPYTPSTACSGDACKGTLPAPPPVPVAVSVTFTGPGNATPAPTLRTRTVHGSPFVVKVAVPRAGRIRISGVGIRSVHKSVPHAGTYGIKVALTPRARSTLRHRRKLRLTLHVTYGPTGGSAATARVRLTVLPALRHAVRRSRKARIRQPGGAR